VAEPRFTFAWCVLALAGATACSKPGTAAKPSASTPTAAAVSAPHASQVKPACRALLVVGRATVDGAPIATSALLDGAHWVELEAGASVALRHTLTSREFKLIGPARVLPCRNGAEQLLLSFGQMSTSANLGVRPGAEVLIATPAGIVRYGDAALDLEFGIKGLSVRVKQGEAWVEPEEHGKPAFKNPLHNGGEAHLAAQHSSARALADACQTAAETAQESAQRVLDNGAAGAESSLGVRAAAHMRARSKARVACAIAASAAFAASDPAERQSLSASVAHSDELWQMVPHAGSGQKN